MDLHIETLKRHTSYEYDDYQRCKHFFADTLGTGRPLLVQPLDGCLLGFGAEPDVIRHGGI